MANIVTNPSFYPRRLSSYVPAMAYASDVNWGGDTRLSFGAPVVASTTYYLSGQSMTTAGSIQAAALTNATSDGVWGRTVRIVASGASTGTVTIDGWDYLNQPMSENLTLNGATAVTGNKAFKTLRQVTWTATSAVNLSVGQGPGQGLPYKAIKVLSEEVNGGPTTVGTLTAPDQTDPATVTTNDPRGIFTANSTLNGTNVITATFMFANDVNANNNGGLLGIPHFSN